MTKDSRPKHPPFKKNHLIKKSIKKRLGTSSITKANDKKPPPVKKTRLSGCLMTLGIMAALMATGGIVVGGIWLAIQLMINPNGIVWINQFLPEWTRIPIASNSPPQTLSDIQEEARKNGLIPGEIQTLKDSELLLPLFDTTPNCQSDCEKIVELRVYHPTKSRGKQKYYQLVSQLPISGPQEYYVLSAAVGTKGNPTLSRVLPLTKFSLFDDKAPNKGAWFMLSGQRPSGDPPITYGQLIHYNPEQMHLSVMVQWTSPNQLSPYWQQITNSTTPELVVNQTADLEPKIKVYQIQPRPFVPDPIYLQEISLAQPAIDTPVFRQALMLARNGLWSLAKQLLQSQKQKKWSTAAQTQLDVIQLHAQITASQAKQAWASPSQQIFANLLDGRWEDGLLVLQASASGEPMQEIATMLKIDPGGLFDRVEAALKVNPNDSNIITWKVLIIAAQTNREKAIAWLKQFQKNQAINSEENSQINDLLDHLEDTTDGLNNGNRVSQIIGTAQQVTTVKLTDWLQLTEVPKGKKAPPLQKTPQQVWYQVQISAFHDGQRWQQMPFTKLKLPKVVRAKPLWKYLGLNADSQIQIAVWNADGQQQSTAAKIKGVSYQKGVLRLLAAGEVLQIPVSSAGAMSKSHPLAYTESTMTWLEPASITLTDLNQIQPQLVSALLPKLWRELVKSSKLKSAAIPSVQAMLGEMGYWSARLVDLTGNNQPDIVLTLYEDSSGVLKKPDVTQPVEDSKLYKPRTLIFSDKGVLLYSEFSQDAATSLTAIADLGDGASPALVIVRNSNYSIKRWSSKGQRFE